MAAEAFSLPSPGTLPEIPRRYHRRVVRERDVKEICIQWGNAAAKEFAEKAQVLWPVGAFNPIPVLLSDAANHERHLTNRRDANSQLQSSITFHPGFRDAD